MHFSEWSSLFRLLLTFGCGSVISAFSATSATLLVHSQLWDIAGVLYQIYLLFLFMQAPNAASPPWEEKAPAFRPSPPATTLSWCLSFQLFLSSGVILHLGPSLAATSSTVSHLFAGLFPDPSSPDSCLLLPVECRLWGGTSAHASQRRLACILLCASSWMLVCIWDEAHCAAALEPVPQRYTWEWEAC